MRQGFGNPMNYGCDDGCSPVASDQSTPTRQSKPRTFYRLCSNQNPKTNHENGRRGNLSRLHSPATRVNISNEAVGRDRLWWPNTSSRIWDHHLNKKTPTNTPQNSGCGTVAWDGDWHWGSLWDYHNSLGFAVAWSKCLCGSRSVSSQPDTGNQAWRQFCIVLSLHIIFVFDLLDTCPSCRLVDMRSDRMGVPNSPEVECCFYAGC